MAIQILVGTMAILATVALTLVFVWVAMTVLVRLGPWLVRPPHNAKYLASVLAVVLWLQMVVTVCVWFWALVLYGLGAFESFEPAFYFAIVAFTTLGLGDLTPAHEWRILAGFISSNGFTTYGMIIAFLVEWMRRVRNEQMAGRADRE